MSFLCQTLATAQGNILENRELIDSLNQTKASSALIQESLLESHRLQASLDQVLGFWHTRHCDIMYNNFLFIIKIFASLNKVHILSCKYIITVQYSLTLKTNIQYLIQFQSAYHTTHISNWYTF